MLVRQHEGSGTVFVSHSKGGGVVERGGDPCGRPGNHPHCWRPFSQVQVFSHCAEQRGLPSSALAIRSLCDCAEMWVIIRRSPCGEDTCQRGSAPCTSGLLSCSAGGVRINFCMCNQPCEAMALLLAASTASVTDLTTTAPVCSKSRTSLKPSPLV